MDNRMAAVERAVNYISGRTAIRPTVGLILGSGLGVLGDRIPGGEAIDYESIPDFPTSTVEGHAGRLVFGELGGKRVVVMQGRFHYYEGYSMDEVVFPVRVMKKLGVETLVVTNAAGGVNTSFSPGDLMIITDHIKLFTDSPLRGPNIDTLGPRFNDMSAAYTPQLRTLAKETAARLGMTVREGVYAHMAGPSFETPAEIKMLRTLGADAVGMSTVPEVICAAHAAMRVLGISAISNMAAGILDQPLNHEEVIETGHMVRDAFISLVGAVVEAM